MHIGIILVFVFLIGEGCLERGQSRRHIGIGAGRSITVRATCTGSRVARLRIAAEQRRHQRPRTGAHAAHDAGGRGDRGLRLVLHRVQHGAELVQSRLAGRERIANGSIHGTDGTGKLLELDARLGGDHRQLCGDLVQVAGQRNEFIGQTLHPTAQGPLRALQCAYHTEQCHGDAE